MQEVRGDMGKSFFKPLNRLLEHFTNVTYDNNNNHVNANKQGLEAGNRRLFRKIYDN